MAPVRELVPSVVRAYTRAGDDLGVGRLPWPNVAPGDVVAIDEHFVRVVDVVTSPPGSVVDALVKVAPLAS